jgi:precorrin-3B methylase
MIPNPIQASLGGGPTQRIMEVLRAYKGKHLPIAFVAHVVGRRTNEVISDLENLEKSDVIKLDKDKDEVWLP